MTKNSIVPAVLLGSAIGDALGMPFEMRACDHHPDLDAWDGTMVAGKSHLDLPAGNWTDDTEMAVALAKSLIEEKSFNVRKVAQNYLAWYRHKPTGIGHTVAYAMKTLEAYDDRSNYLISGVKLNEAESVGAGTVMRVAPIGVLYSKKPDAIRWAVKSDAFITHIHQEAYAASLAVASFIAGAIRYDGPDASPDFQKKAAYDFMDSQLSVVVPESLTYRALKQIWTQRLNPNMNPSSKFADEVAGRWGCAWQIATTAIHCALRNWHSFKDGVTEAVRLGGDADTRGAVTGAILGAVNGARRMPPEWIEKLVNVNMGNEWSVPGKCAGQLSQLDLELWQTANL